MEEQNQQMMKMFQDLLESQRRAEDRFKSETERLRKESDEREQRLLMELQNLRGTEEAQVQDQEDEEEEPPNPRDTPAAQFVSSVKVGKSKPPQFSGKSKDFELWKEDFEDFGRLWRFQRALTRTRPIRIGDDVPRVSRDYPVAEYDQATNAWYCLKQCSSDVRVKNRIKLAKSPSEA